jgi:phosphoglucomutase
MTVALGEDPGTTYTKLTKELGDPAYRRIDAPATADEKKTLLALSPDAITTKELAGEPITSIITRAPGNDAPIGGLKVSAKDAWFAVRPSGTEEIYKLYAESFRGEEHLDQVIAEARTIVASVLK